jgi:hypothetical protein
VKKFLATLALLASLASPAGAQIVLPGGSAGGGTGTVTTFSVVTANGVSASVANPTTTPAATFSLGAITPSSVAIGAGSAITSSGAGGALGTGAFVAAAPCTAFGTAAGTCAQGGVITAGGPTGSATVAPIITYNAAGQLTTVSSATITPAVGSITGLGTGVATALGNNIGSAGAPVTFNGALGTPSSGVATNLTGTAASLTAGNVTTNANLTGPITSVGNATSIASQTGTGTKFVVDTSPTLVTPTLGVATATSLNGNTFTTGTYTLTGAAAKTLTFNNSLTLAGTDATTQTFPATSATIARIDAAQTFNGTQTFQAAGAGANLAQQLLTQTTTSTGSQSFAFSNDVGPSQIIFAIENSAAANTTLINVPHSGLIRTSGGSSGGLFIGTSSNSGNIVLFAGGNVTATNSALSISGSGQQVTIGSATPAAGQRGDLAQIKETDAAAAPGAGYAVLKWVAGTNAGTCKLISYAGTSATPVTVVDNVGGSC